MLLVLFFIYYVTATQYLCPLQLSNNSTNPVKYQVIDTNICYIHYDDGRETYRKYVRQSTTNIFDISHYSDSNCANLIYRDDDDDDDYEDHDRNIRCQGTVTEINNQYPQPKYVSYKTEGDKRKCPNKFGQNIMRTYTTSACHYYNDDDYRKYQSARYGIKNGKLVEVGYKDDACSVDGYIVDKERGCNDCDEDEYMWCTDASINMFIFCALFLFLLF